ncbi:MAG: hypothetical protein F6K20_38335, partial [Moorea sp. SIO2C4]|nr:hypothetical protein [Moorena sp. SIO2C4]
PIPDSLLGGVRGGFRFPIPDSRFPILNSRILNSKFPVPFAICCPPSPQPLLI